MAAIVASIDAMEAEGIIEHAGRSAPTTSHPAWPRSPTNTRMIGEVRGLGVFWALDLVSDAASRTPVGGTTMGQLKTELMARGLLPFIADNRIHVVPPCVVTADEVAEALAIYDEAFSAIGA